MTKGTKIVLTISVFLALVISLNVYQGGFVSHAQDEAQSENADPILDIQVVESTSGEIEAWLVEDHSVPVISLRFFFKASGAWYDEQDQGITYFLSSMLDEGAGEYDSQGFQRLLEDYNLSLSFSGGRDDFGGSLYMLSKYKEQGVEALKLALTKPRFEDEAMERMRRQLIAAARRRMGDPDWAAARLINHYGFADHFYALNSGGTISNLERFSADDLRQFVKDNFAKDRLKVSVAGDITAEELRGLLDEIFGDLPTTSKEHASIKDVEFTDNPPIVAMEKDIQQTFIRLVWPSIAYDDADYAAFQVMNYVLGSGGFSSRLMAEIREKRGLTYGVYSSASNFDHASRLTVSMSTDHQNVNEARDVILEETKRIMSEEVTDDELERAKNYLTGSLVLAFTSTRSIGGGVNGLQYRNRPIDYLDGYKERILNVTKEDVRRVAERIFENQSPLEVYVGEVPKLERDVTVVDSIPNAE